MRALILALVALVAIGCDIEPDNARTDAPVGVGDMVKIAGVVVSEWLGEDAPVVDVEIVWLEGECVKGIGDKCYMGRYVFNRPWNRPDIIYVVYLRNVWETALAHELVHFFQQRIDGDPDIAHGSEWWLLVAEINYRTKKRRERLLEASKGVL